RLADGAPITRVALDLGYDSVPAFITMFKRMLGSSPRGYMRGARDNGEAMRRAPARLEAPTPSALPQG
ncbi:MAG: AraC family transcriptional regulator, partial [Mesorhizobium sp.]